MTTTQATIDSFRTGFAGVAMTPDAEDYDEVRAIWNGSFDKRRP